MEGRGRKEGAIGTSAHHTTPLDYTTRYLLLQSVHLDQIDPVQVVLARAWQGGR